MEEKTLTIKLTENDIHLLQYWRESCHNYNKFCPLHCIQKGTDFCHQVTEKLKAQIKEQKGE